jgi:hypothetical protein
VRKRAFQACREGAIEERKEAATGAEYELQEQKKEAKGKQGSHHANTVNSKPNT